MLMEFKPNPNQQKVLDHQNGPLLIVAGAGTGKTRTITDKIIKLLDEGVNPAEILAVTFTEKAAAEMAERVQENRQGLLLDLPILTYNGYGDSILREFGIHIGLPRTYRLLTPQSAIVFMRERIDEFDLSYFLPLSTIPDSIIEDILSYFSKLKQNLVTPDAYTKFVSKLPQSDDVEKADKNMHTQLVEAYQTYVKLCRLENVIDYDDQIYLTIELLKTRPNVCKVLNERYHTVFVDEFQDTNYMQSELIDLIVPPSKNLIVVGDDDQAIYGFRGANIGNILSFKQRYKNAAEVALTENYRSHQSILDAAYKLIQNNNPNRLESSLGLDKRLTSSKPGSEPTLHRFHDQSSELGWLASDISARLKTLGPNDKVSIAVLTRSNNSAQAVHQALSSYDVPHVVVGLNPDLYTRPIVRTILELVRTINEPDNNASLHHTLISELFGISNSFLSPHANKARYQHDNLEDILSVLPETKQAISLIRTWREAASSENVAQLLWRALDETGLIKKLLDSASSDDAAGLSLGYITQYFDTLKDFINIATQPTIAQYQLSLPALMSAGEATDSTIGLSEQEVIVTTVHKAKGLEWDTVYLPQLTEQKFPMWNQGSGLDLPEELSRDKDVNDHYSEERRVMYVAVTRARQNLLFSFSDGPRKPSRFLGEMFGKEVIDSLEHTDTIQTSSKVQLPSEDVPKVAVPTKIYDGKRVTLDVTKAQTLLNCPLNFYYKYVLDVPREPDASADYGTRLHDFIQEINESLLNKSELRPLEHILDDLVVGWNKYGYASKAQQERALKQAKQTLSNYYQLATKSPAPIAVEEEFAVEIDKDLILDGRIDAVYDNDGIEIRDFKTGYAARDEAGAKKKAGESRQLELYALAWLTKTGELPAKLSLHYVDTELVGYANKRPDTIEKRRQQLIEAVEELKKGNFPPGSNHKYCVHPEV